MPCQPALSFDPPQRLRLGALFSILLGICTALAYQDSKAADCQQEAADACYQSIQLTSASTGAAATLHYYSSRAPQPAQVRADRRGPSTDPASDAHGTNGTNPAPSSPAQSAQPTAAIIALHGHPRDANLTFNATLAAVRDAGTMQQTLVVAPLFQVAAADSAHCPAAGAPAAQVGDLLWTCQSWMEGALAGNADVSANAALDALVLSLIQHWPSLRSITIAGFSAGAQMVQHYIGFAARLPPGAPALRYVIADPGSWLYFDAVRPQAMRAGLPASMASCTDLKGQLGECSFVFSARTATESSADCPTLNSWKYGLDNLPATLGRDGASARSVYAAADIHYIEAELDSRSGRGTAYGALDKSCAANAQGLFRLQRGMAYAQYDNAILAPGRQRRVTVVRGCAHDVSCVFPHPAARAALLGQP